MNEMIRKPSDTSALGLHLDGPHLKLALAAFHVKPQVKRLEDFFLKEEEGEMQFSSPQEGKIADELSAKHLTVASLEGKDVIIRKMKVKLLKEKDVEETFPFEAENHIPYPREDALLDKIYLEKQDDGTLLTILAARKTALNTLLEKYQALKINPEIVGCVPHALAAFAENYSSHKDGLIVYIGFWSTSLAMMKDGKLFSSHSLNHGIENLKKAYDEDLAQESDLLPPFYELDFSSDDLLLAPRLTAEMQKLKQDIQWMIASETKNEKKSSGLSLLVLGEAGQIKNLESALFKDSNLVQAEINAADKSELNIQLLKRFAVAIGSALTALPKYSHPINFRQQDLAYPYPWKRFKGSLIMFAAASLLFALMLFIFGKAYLSYKEDGLRQTYVETLASIRKSNRDFEQTFQKKYLQKREGVEIPAIKDLSVDDINARLSALEKEIEQEPDLFALYPQVPTVSDTLAWLSNHPEIKGEEGSISIENFSYTMIKRPEMTKKGEKYQVKVDLELSAPTPKLAREFHNALIAPNDFVDPKGEVKWNASRGKYVTSFYLKDKTFYPPGAGHE